MPVSFTSKQQNTRPPWIRSCRTRKVIAPSCVNMKALSSKKKINASLHGPDAALYGQAMQAYWAEWLQNPAKIMEHQIAYWGKSVTHYIEAQQALAKGKLQAPEDPGPKARRFKIPMLVELPYFNFIKQLYLIFADAI